MIFDTHVHYNDRSFDEDREQVLTGLAEKGVGAAAVVGASLADSVSAAALAEAWPFLYASAGVHPDETSEPEALGEEAALGRLEALLARPKVLAVGEIGLDYFGYDRYPDKPDKALQQKWFALQLRLARRLDKPVLIHSRDAAADTLELMQREGGAAFSAVIHCFSYEWEMAKRFLDLGYYLGVGGVVTYKNGRKLKEVAAAMPLDRLLLETDGPYLAPSPLRGSRNDSGNLPLVVQEIARLKGISPEEVEQVSWENARRFYRL